MTITDIITDKTLFDIHSPTLVEDMTEVIPEIADFKSSVPIENICQYLILMYDISSPMRDEVRLYYERKYRCAALLDFPTNKTGFIPEVEGLFIGTNFEFNKLIASYIAQMGLPEYTQLVAYLEIQKIHTMAIFSGKASDKADQILERVTVAIGDITKKLFGSGQDDEIVAARKALYQRSTLDKSRLIPRPEVMVKIMETDGELPDDCNPYGEDYEVEPSHFIGDEDPSK